MKRSRKRSRTRKAARKSSPKRPARIRANVPRTAKQFFATPAAFQDTWTSVTHVISKMRADRVSLREASREFGLDPRVVARLGKSALRKRSNGQYAAKHSDKLLRILAVPTPDGVREVAMRDSLQATQLGRYWAAVQKYLQTGDTTELKKFKRRRIVSADGKRIRLITNPEQLSQLGHAGVLSFESLYASVSR